MKKVILLILLLIDGTSNAQTLVDTNKVWHVVSCLNFGPCETTMFHFGADTTIGTHLYKKLIADLDSNGGGFTLTNPIPIAAREDTTTKQIFYHNGTVDYLVYDFSLNQGDTFVTNNGSCGYQLTVDSVDSITLLNGEQRKRMFLIGIGSEVWIEGIGSLLGLTNEGIYFCTVDVFPELNCFEEDSILKFHSSTYANCYYNSVGIEELYPKRKYSLRPNPFSDYSILTFNNPSREMCSLKIINMESQVVETRTNIFGNEIVLYKDHLKKGIYFFQLSTTENIIASGKIVIQ